MTYNKVLTYAEFQSNPELNAKFGGDYTRYLDNYAATLAGTGIFNFAAQNQMNIPELEKASIFFSSSRLKSTDNQTIISNKQSEKDAKIQEKLDKIRDPKIRAQVEEELYSRNLSDAFFDLLLDRYEKKKNEFEEIWAKYQLAKGEAADMKKTCERLLREYKNNQSASARSNYKNAERAMNHVEMLSDIYLSEAMDASHRVL